MINKSSQKIFNNSLLYSLGTVLSKAVGFFLVPIYTYFIAKDDYGIGTTITSFVSTFGIVIMLSLRAAMIRFYNEYDDEEKKRFVGTITCFVLINSVVVCTLLCLLNKLYMPFLFKGVDFFPCVFWGVMSLGAEGIYLVYQSLMQAKQDGKAYSLNSVVYLIFHGLTVVLFVGVLRMGVLGMVLSNFASNIAFAVYGIISMSRKKCIIVCIDGAMLKKSLKYSLPILPHNMSNNLNTYSIKLVISHFLGYAMSGLYTLASQFSTIVNLVQNSVNLAFRPWFVEQMQLGKEGRAQIKYMSCMIMALYAFCSVGVALFSKEIIVIMSEHTYWEAWRMVPLFVLAQLISFIYYSHVQTLMYNVKMSKFTVICSFSGLVVNVGVSLLLVQRLEAYGILIAMIISKIVLSSVAVIMSNRAENVDFGLPKMILYILLAAVLSGAGMWVAQISGEGIHILEILVKLVLLVIAAVAFMLPYRKDFGILIKGIIKKKK